MNLDNLKVELTRIRKQIEHPTGPRWQKYDDLTARKKHAKLVDRAKQLASTIYDLTGEEF